MGIAFNTISLNLLTPGAYVEFDNSKASTGLAVQTSRTLLIAQRTAAGAVAACVPTKIYSGDQGAAAFGLSSQLARMIKTFVKGNPYNEVWAAALDDNGAGVQASGSITFAGSPTQAGTLNLYIDSDLVQVAISSAMTAAQVATATVAAIAALASLNGLPVTAAVDGTIPAKVNLTAVHKGVHGNYIDLRFNYYQGDVTPAGLTYTVVPMAGGTANPTIASAFSAIGDSWYTSFVMPYIDTANLTAMDAELTRRWGGMTQIDGMCFVAASGTMSAIDTLASSLNSPFICMVGRQNSPSPALAISAAVATQDAAEPDPARPRQTLPLIGVLPPLMPDRYLQTDRNVHLKDGAATFVVDAGGQPRIERLVTTYKTNAVGAPDASYRDVETMRTLSYLRFSVRVRFLLKYPRHKLAQDGTPIAAGQPILTPSAARMEMICLYQDWMQAGLVEGGAAFDQFKQDLIVQINGSDPNRLDIVLPPNLINQLRVVAAQIQFRT
jgi:phage tail sheath gpL-like